MTNYTIVFIAGSQCAGLGKANNESTPGTSKDEASEEEFYDGPPAKKSRLGRGNDLSQDGDEFHYSTLSQLQRVCLIEQIKAARAQRTAAVAQEKYFCSIYCGTEVVLQ
jgi:hypothetical protein